MSDAKYRLNKYFAGGQSSIAATSRLPIDQNGLLQADDSAPSGDIGRTDDGDQLLDCLGGYLASCGRCPRVAPALSGYTFCSLEKAADPSCGVGVSTSFCRIGVIEGCAKRLGSSGKWTADRLLASRLRLARLCGS